MQATQRTVGPPSSRWDFHGWQQCAHAGDAQVFSSRDDAFLWLAQFRSEPGALTALRSYVAASGSAGQSLWRASDDQVLKHLAHQLSSGALHVHRVAAPATAWRAAVSQSGPAATQAVATRRPGSTPAPPPPAPRSAAEADTFSAATDALATAAVLRNAAENGVPFCEECAKAAAAAADRKAA